MRNAFTTLMIVIGVICFMFGVSMMNKYNSRDFSSEESLKFTNDSLQRALQECKDVRISIDFGNEVTPQKARAIYSDEQIRRLRKQDLDHIYQTKGRYRTTSDEVFDQRVQDYIDDNYEQILDEHGR